MNSGIPISNNSDIDFSHPDERFLRSIDVHTLLPQQEPFVMISELAYYDPILTVCELQVNVSNLFVENGHLTGSGLIEHIAQTCACRIGYINKYILKKGIQIGFIGAVRNLHITRNPRVGECVTTEVKVEEEIFGMILANARVKVGEEVIAETSIKIAIQEE